MGVVEEVARRFAAKGWFAYLVRGGNCSDGWQWLEVYRDERSEGYGKGCRYPNYYRRVK